MRRKNEDWTITKVQIDQIERRDVRRASVRGSSTVLTAPEHVHNQGRALDLQRRFRPVAHPNDRFSEAHVDETLISAGMSADDFRIVTDEWADLFANPPTRIRTANLAGDYMPVDQARVLIEAWKTRAMAQFKDPAARRRNSEKTILSLFDLSGEWSKPWREAGYNVLTFDIQSGQDIMDFCVEYFVENYDITEVYGILAACPCTDFAVSGARHFAGKDADGRTEASKDLVFQTLRTIDYFRPAFWALENPVGRIESLTGLPKARLIFEPHHFGETYTKKTLLWGKFNANLPTANVDPVEGSKMWAKYGGKSQATKNARSVTPEGFSYAFFMANNYEDMPVADKLATQYPEASGAVHAALEAGVTEQEIHDLMNDTYGNYEYEEARNALLAAVAERIGGAEYNEDEEMEDAPAA